MRLYHSTFMILLVGLAGFFLKACTPAPAPTQALISGEVYVDGQTYQIQLIPGSTVAEALDSLGIELDVLDRVEPLTSTVLSDKAEINITRIREEFEIEQVEIPFDQKRLPTELLSEGVEKYDPLQIGQPGLREITIRIVYENGIEVSRTQIKSVVIKEPQSQIILFGTQQKHSPLNMPGKLIYLSQGNAILFEGNTANRLPLINSGDLDGRVFSLSDDGRWLLFTRRGESEEVINTLWVIDLENLEREINLKTENIIHFADWVPGSKSQFVYSTVEPRPAAPGWQANNNLLFREFSINGWVPSPKTLLESNSGGVYGWWGIDFSYDSTNTRLAYVGPDQIGILDVELGVQEIILPITPFQTRSDWAWVPGLNWSPDGNVLFTVTHAPPPGSVAPEESPNFDLTAILMSHNEPVSLVLDVGMFAYPISSPVQIQPSGESAYQVAYLQAIFPQQSDTSRYRLMIMDRDGSNSRLLFPGPEAPGIEPSQAWGAWSPTPLEHSGHYAIAVLYQGNIWLIDSVTGEASQVTGDGMIDRILWH